MSHVWVTNMVIQVYQKSERIVELLYIHQNEAKLCG